MGGVCCGCASRSGQPKKCASTGGSAFAGIVADMAGVRERLATYTGTVTIQNQLSTEARLEFVETKLVGSHICFCEVKSGEEYAYDPGESKQFDYLLVVRSPGSARLNTVRGGIYKLTDQGGTTCVEPVSLPERVITDKLANVPGLSVSLSASGWLVIYQLGAAECLQNHGVVRNPYARVSGASGGALTAAIMMYGADPRAVKDVLLDCAKKVHSDFTENIGLRRFNVMAMETIIRDGSYQHPAFVSQRIEIGITKTRSKLPGFFGKMLLTGSEERCKDFKTSTDIAIALLASSTCGITGLPFETVGEDGKKHVVADGAFKNFLPTIDKFSIKIKPLCDGLGFATAGLVSGERADVGPTEFVTTTFGVFPPPITMLEHLYELGYQDMQAWIDNKLDKRLSDLRESRSGDEAPFVPVSWKCDNNGMLWLDELKKKVPISWVDMLAHSFYMDKKAIIAPLHEGVLQLEALRFYERGPANEPVLKNTFNISYKFWVRLTMVDLQWSPENMAGSSAGLSEEDSETMMRGLLATGFFGASEETVWEKAQTGKVHLTWLSDVLVDPDAENILHVKTANYCVTLKATSAEAALEWKDAIQKALRDIRAMVQGDGME